MRKVSDVVRTIIETDDIACESMRGGVLNLSAYAKKIKKQVDSYLYKDVRENTIVAALARIKDDMASVRALKPSVCIRELNVRSSLAEVTYERTQATEKKLREIQQDEKIKIFSVIFGVGEVSVLALKDSLGVVKKAIKAEPKGFYENLSAITLRFSESEYVEIPNMIYTLVGTLAFRRVNLIEIISTLSEISFVVRERDTQITIDSFQSLLIK